MDRLLDASLWIDFTRVRSPRALKQFIVPHINDPLACLAEPVMFEILRGASEREMPQLLQQFATLPVLESPENLWERGAALGRACRRIGLTPPSIDLLIASVAIAHDAELVTFDTDFRQIAGVSTLRVDLLTRPAGTMPK